MIITDLNGYNKLDLDCRIGEVLDFIKNQDLENIAVGRYEVTKTDFFTVVETKTEPAEDRVWEYHKNYLDIHIVLQGLEVIQLNLNSPDESLYGEYNELDDYILSLDNDIGGFKSVELKKHQALILYPFEQHKPLVCEEIEVMQKTLNGAEQEIKKAKPKKLKKLVAKVWLG